MDIREQTQGFSLKGKSALIIGCGGLGCNIAIHLVGSGIEKLYLCDFDKVNESNLNRQFLYTKNDIGKLKCEVMKEKLLSYNNEIEILASTKKIETTEDIQDFAKCDIIILAVDNIYARKVAEEFCFENDIPLVCGGIDNFYGFAYLYLPKKTACLSCASMTEGDETHFSVSSVAGIIGSMQATLTIKYLLGECEEISGNLLIYDGYRWDTLTILPSKECKKCKNI